MQATTAWSVTRGRLAEADILLAAVLAWTIVAFDHLRSTRETGSWRFLAWRGVFFGLLGLTFLIKGIGFGAVLIAAIVGTMILIDRDRETWRRLRSPVGWGWVLAFSLAWPVAMVARHGLGALGLWTLHVADRFASRPEQFAGESWWQYGSGILIQALPWTPLAVAGAWRSLGRALVDRRESGSIDRLLWVWGVVPLALLSMATVKNAHYVIYAQVPWSIWAALGLSKLAERLQRRGWGAPRLRRAAALGFWLDRRGNEWGFYESAGRRLAPGEPVAFLYDDWDRNPYPTPFGPIPHDLAVRLYYLNRPACWHFDPKSLASCERCGSASTPKGFALFGRDRDRPALGRIGRVEVIANGPETRFDRTYLLMRIRPESRTALR